ncbi:MinD/ParA family protein [Mycolicibacterium peregrinum]|uniref:MinD/ParA family ATP-binding protein n=1 Tax=Mycolicibacterium peregrinum TaxID=43304 RepID=UPI0009EF5D9B|nr:MinD/ParA family protein [Mycolicibacterium peregrinum]
MSGDYDRLFHPPQPEKPVDDATISVDRDAIMRAAAAAPQPMPTWEPPQEAAPPASPEGHDPGSGQHAAWDPGRATHTGAQLPPPMAQPPASEPNWPQRPAPTLPQAFAPGEWPDQPPAALRHAGAPGPYPGHETDFRTDGGATWGAPPQEPFPHGTQQSASTNSRAIDSLAHVNARGGTPTPSQRGWRHWLYTCTRINLGPSPDEIYETELHNRIRRNTRDAYQIGVIGLKGGAGKTTVSMTLGSTLAKIRGDRVLAIDADPDAGNLVDRGHRQSAATITDLLAQENVSRYNEIRGYTSMNGSNLEVLSSQDYSSAQREFNDEDWIDATAVVSRFYNLVIADTGRGLFQSAARGVLGSISGLVIVASASLDGARQAAVTMDWLRQNGYQDLLSRACVVINHVTPSKPNVDIADLEQQFQRHLPEGRVIVLPWDKHVALGTEIQLAQLSRTFQRRIVELAAALSDDFSSGHQGPARHAVAEANQPSGQASGPVRPGQ